MTDVRPKQYSIRCAGCDFRFTGTLEQISRKARQHDDSPARQHIVHMDPPAVWPKGT